MYLRLPSRFLAVLLVALALVFPASAQTEPQVQTPAATKSQARVIIDELLKNKRILPSSQVKAGMKGIARSVFKGTAIEEFPVEVIGVLEKAMGGSDLILIKVLGGPVVRRESGIIAGMSGSPVYIDGKMIGAIAIGWSFPKEPIGGVTPIVDMIETSLPDNSRTKTVAAPAAPSSAETSTAPEPALEIMPTSYYRPKTPLRVAGRDIATVAVSREPQAALISGPPFGATMHMQPCTQLLQVSGVLPSSLPRIRSVLAPFGLEPVIGAPTIGHLPSQVLSPAQVMSSASEKPGVQPPFEPGGAIGVQLVTGDLDMTAVGTITFRWGDRILAFGHPMLGKGIVSMPMTTAYVHDIFPSYQQSFKLASPVQRVGALQQDNAFAIGGTLGVKPDMVPMSVALRDPSRQINKTYNIEMIKDPLLTPQLMQMVAMETLQTRFGLDSDKMVRVAFKMQLDDGPPIVKRDYVYARDAVVLQSLNDLMEAMFITQNNPFKRGAIQSVELEVVVEDQRKTAEVTQVTADHNIIKAGDTLRVKVEITPTNQPNAKFYREFDFPVPADSPPGAMTIAAGSSDQFWQVQARVGGAPPQTDTYRDLLEAYRQIGPTNTLLVQASMPRRFLMFDGKRVYDPPPSWSKLVPPVRASDIGAFNEVQRKSLPSEYSLSGLESVTVQIESARLTDRNQPDTVASGASGSTSSSLPTTSTATSLSSLFDWSEEAATPRVTANSRVTATELWLRSLQATAPAAGLTATLPGFGTGVETGAQANTDLAAAWRDLQTPKLPPRLQAAFEARPPVPPVELQEPPVQPMPTPTPIVPPQPPVVITENEVPPAPVGSTPTPTPAPTVQPTPTPEAGNPNLARPSLTWTQNTTTDFDKGTYEGTRAESESATMPASLRRAPVAKLLGTTAESFAWSIAGDDAGNTYLGTGHLARIVRITPDGAQQIIYDGSQNEVAVTALATDNAGHLYAGITPGGRVLRLDLADNTVTTLLNTGQSFVWALAFDGRGNLLAATGGENGLLYRVENAATNAGVTGATAQGAVAIAGPQPFARVPQRHIRALAMRGDEIFAGTADEAVLYRIDANSGAATALFQSTAKTEGGSSSRSSISVPGMGGGTSMFVIGPGGMSGLGGNAMSLLAGAQGRGGIYPVGGQSASQNNEILALATAPEGVYFGTSQSGAVYRWSSENGVAKVATVYTAPKQNSVYALQRGANGQLYAAIGDEGDVYSIRPAATAKESTGALLMKPIQKQSLALTLTSGGDILVGTGNNAAAYRLSRDGAADLYTSNVFDAGNIVRWGALRFSGAGATIETRSGNTREPDALWSDWQPATRNDLGEYSVASPAARYLQYRARLSGEEATLSNLAITFRPRNQAPSVQFADIDGKYFSNSTKLTWKGQDPDQDTLRYRLWLAPANSETWQPVELKNRTATTDTIDTKKYSDGVYRAKIEASDAARNPADPRRTEDISAPFIIDNTPPRIEAPGLVANADGTWTLTATAADDLAPIAGAEWRVVTPEQNAEDAEEDESDTSTTTESEATESVADEAEADEEAAAITVAMGAAGGTAPTTKEAVQWQAVAAADDIFDSRRERLIASLDNDLAATELKPGTQIELRVRDAAGNHAKLMLTLP